MAYKPVVGGWKFPKILVGRKLLIGKIYPPNGAHSLELSTPLDTLAWSNLVLKSSSKLAPHGHHRRNPKTSTPPKSENFDATEIRKLRRRRNPKTPPKSENFDATEIRKLLRAASPRAPCPRQRVCHCGPDPTRSSSAHRSVRRLWWDDRRPSCSGAPPRLF